MWISTLLLSLLIMPATVINYHDANVATSGSLTAASGDFNSLRVNNNSVIVEGDSRLNDSRPPTPHAHTFEEVATTGTYTNFLPSSGDLSVALSGIDSAISGKASLDDDVSFTSITFAGNSDNTLEYDLIQMSLVSINCTQGLVLGTGLGITFPDSSVQTTAGAALGHAHSAADVTSGVFDPARIPQFDVLTDTVSSTTYTGRAADGSATSASVWKIRKTVYTSAGAVSSTGTATNVKWDDRLTTSYS